MQILVKTALMQKGITLEAEELDTIGDVKEINIPTRINTIEVLIIKNLDVQRVLMI